MQTALIARILGILIVIYSFSMLPPLGVSLWYHDGAWWNFVLSFFFMLGVGLGLWFSSPEPLQELEARDGFVITVVFWVVLSIISSLPLLFIAHISLSDAVFEAISGFTTTGATVIVGLDQLPKSILYYRSQLHLLGGLGIIVLAMAILPMLGVGGMQLYRAEAPGPMREDKITPRLSHTVKALIYVYFGLTAACGVAYWQAGMSPFDAVLHSFGTVSTGGFSPYDASFAHFNSPLIEFIAIIFMWLGSLNFALHYLSIYHLNINYHWRDPQTVVFTEMLLVLILISTLTLFAFGSFPDLLTCLRHASFHVVSIVSSTGFTTTGFTDWPSFLPALILGSAFIGGCVGGTTGGIKILRVILLYKQALREIQRLIHPNAVIPVRIGNIKVSSHVAEAVWGFSMLYLVSFLFLSFLLLAVDPKLDLVTAFAAIATCLNLVGPGLGKVASNFVAVNELGLWICSLAMLLGRLEIFTVLVLFMPSFWNK